jgi:uncharacterized protein
MLEFDWASYTGNLKWLKDNTFYLTRHGSMSYGTNVPTSDLDIRGIVIPPKEYYIGLTNNFEQATSKDPDLVIFELRKFLKLASECNPNALEILFTEKEDHYLDTPQSRLLLDSKNIFLSKRVKFTFQGYAHSQMKRILLHRRWLLNPPSGKPERSDFGLPERSIVPKDQLAAANAAIKKQCDDWSWHEMEILTPSQRQDIQDEFERRLLEITKWNFVDLGNKIWLSAVNTLGFSTNFIDLLDKERRYTTALRDWQHYLDWKENRNPVRAKMEAESGFDRKHALHLVRLSRCCKELLTEGILRVKRPDAAELLAIRCGAWTFEKLFNWFEEQSKELDYLYEKCTVLPHLPNMNKISELSMELIDMSWR